MRFFILLCVVVAWFGNAQVKTIDSLKQLLNSHKNQDTVYLHLLNEIAWYECFHDARTGLKIADSAIALAQKLKNREGLITGYSRKAVNLNTLGQDSLALQYYDQLISIHKGAGDSVRLARTVFNKGILYFKRSDYVRSTSAYQRALSIFKAEKDTLVIGKVLNSIGINQMTLAQYPTALDNYLTAARMYEKAQQTSTLDYANILSNIGLLEARLGDIEEASIYQNKALQLFKKLDYKENVANALNNLGNISKDKGNVDEALAYYKQALILMREVGNKLGVANALCNIGAVYIVKNEQERAIAYLDSTRPMYEEIHNTTNLCLLHQSLGEAYKSMYFKSRQAGFLITAQDHFETAIQIASSNSILNLAQEAWESLGDTHSLQQHYEEAFKADEIAMQLKDSLNMMSQKEETARLEEAYLYEQKEVLLRKKQLQKEIKAQLEIEKQKTITDAIVIVAVLGTVILFLLWLLNKRKREVQAAREHTQHELKIAKTQLKALQAQLNPHFMFNSMNTVAAFILHKNPEEALDFLAKIANLVRRTLQNSEKQFIPLEEELSFLHDYISLEIMRASSKITYAIEIGQELDPENTLIPPAILQPFIENSIWHGPGKCLKDVHIHINIQRCSDQLLCTVDDNGVGRTAEATAKYKYRESMGLKIAKNRIAIINRIFNVNASLALIDKNQGFRIEINLPYQEAF